MLDGGPFEGWEAYRSFVETAQSSLQDRLRERCRVGEPGLGAPPAVETTASLAEPFEREWVEPLRGKWLDERGCDPDAYRQLFELLPGDPVERAAAAEECASGLVRRENVDDRLGAALDATPGSLLGVELWLDAAACYAVAAVDAGESARATAYDAAPTGAAGWVVRPVDHVLREELFASVDRESFVSGAFVDAWFDRLDALRERLAALTVATTALGPDLARADDALPAGWGRPGSWRIRPTEAVSGLPGGLDGAADATATVTVDRERELSAPGGLTIRGLLDGVVVDADAAFPADAGEAVVVTPANVVERVGPSETRTPHGLTRRQHDRMAGVEADPQGASGADLDLLAAWTRAAAPAPRRHAVEILTEVATGTDALERVRPVLWEATDDEEVAVRRRAVEGLADFAEADPGCLAGQIHRVVGLLEDDDSDVRRHAIRCLSALVGDDTERLVDHFEVLRDCLRAELDPVGRPDDDSEVLDGLIEFHAELAATDLDVIERAADPLVRMAAIENETALELLSAVDRDHSAFETVVDAVEERILVGLREYRPNPPEQATRRVKLFAERLPELVAAAGAGDPLAGAIRGERAAGDDWHTEHRCQALLAAFHLLGADDLAEDDLLAALPSCLDADHRKLVRTGADVVTAAGVAYPDRAGEFVDPLVGLLDHGHCNVRERGALALAMLGAVDRSHVAPAVEPLVDLFEDHEQCGHVRRSAGIALVVAGEHVAGPQREAAIDRVAGNLETSVTITLDILLSVAAVDASVFEPFVPVVRDNPNVLADDPRELLSGDPQPLLDREPGVAYAPTEQPNSCINWSRNC